MKKLEDLEIINIRKSDQQKDVYDSRQAEEYKEYAENELYKIFSKYFKD